MAQSRRFFLVWGAGGHGLVVGDLVRALGHELCGYVDADPRKLGSFVEPLGVPVNHVERELVSFLESGNVYPQGTDAFALGIGDNRQRQERLRSLEGLDAPVLVHPTAAVSPGAGVGRGSVVFALAVVNAGARVGDAVIVNSGAVVEHDCSLEDGVHVSPGAVLCGNVRVGERSWIGAGATVIHGVSIGPDAVVGAGSTVIDDVNPKTTVVGCPARPVKGEVR